MTDKHQTGSRDVGEGGQELPLFAEKPTIKILLYTDDPGKVTPDSKADLGLGRMIERLEAHEPGYARLEPKWVSRDSEGPHARNKIDAVLEREEDETGKPFDEVWFFGLLQANTARAPESELTEREVRALLGWMGERRLGVLMAGDHNDDPPDGVIPGNNPCCPDASAGQKFLGRGRAIGRCVPRAGLLRKWEGAPTYRLEDRNNTIESSGFDTDKVPQELFLRNVNADGEPDLEGQPHPIFRYKEGRWIRVLPDHIHEGTVIQPQKFDPDLWPGQTRPHVVAHGLDKHTLRMLDIIMTYNGDLSGVGRIVADSSWHHYFNDNLLNFPNNAPDGSPADRIGQFYANLAIWLAPPNKRYEMTRRMLWELATYTLLLSPPDDERQIGAEAYAILSKKASPCEVHEMFQVAAPDWVGAHFFPGRSNVLSPLPSQELLLGCILNTYHGEMRRAERATATFRPRGVAEIIDSGFKRAFGEHAEQLSRLFSETQRFI